MASLIKYNGKNILYFNFEFKIFPGINEIEDTVLSGILSHPCFAARFDKGELVLVEDNREGKSKKKKERSEKDVLRMIEDMFDVSMLKKLAETDNRGSVIKAVQDRIKHLSHVSESKKPEIGEDGHFE